MEVGDDSAGDLAQVGGVGQQPGQVAQLAGGELGKRSGSVGLGHVVQQGDEQLVGVGVLLLERYEEHVAATGLVPEARFATWDSEPWEPGRAYAVSVHRRPDR